MRGLGQALIRLRGIEVAGRYRLGNLYAVGAEGAVFLAHDLWDGDAPPRVAKVALLPYHKPFDLSFEEVKRRRDGLATEAGHLERSASPYMPSCLGLFQFENPLLDPERGGEFAEREPILIMEKLPGFDLDLWLARVHSSTVPRGILRRHVDHVAIVVLRGLWDLQERGYFYCDLRPGNVRIRGRSEHRVRLMDAGSLVVRGDTSGGFPHVPAYLPPELFWKSQEEGASALVPSQQIQAVMAGRTLFEVATGRIPVPGEQVDLSLLHCDTVSPEVADTIDGLCTASFADVSHALKYLAKKTKQTAVAASTPPRVTAATAPTAASAPAPASAHAAAAAPAALSSNGRNGKQHRPAPEPVPAAARSRPVVPAPAQEPAPAAASHAAPDAGPAGRRDLASVLAAARANFKPATPSKPKQRLEPAAAETGADAEPRAAAPAHKPAAPPAKPAKPAKPTAAAAPAKPRLPPRRADPNDVDDAILPPSRPKVSLWERILAWFGGARKAD